MVAIKVMADEEEDLVSAMMTTEVAVTSVVVVVVMVDVVHLVTVTVTVVGKAVGAVVRQVVHSRSVKEIGIANSLTAGI